MKKLLHHILSGILGIAVFVVFFVVFDVGLLLSSLFSLVGLVGSYLFFSPRKVDPELQKLAQMHGITPEMIKKRIRQGRGKLRRMKRLGNKADNQKIKDLIMRICEITEKIFIDFKYDPKDIKAARDFLNYYLDTTIKIIEKYTLLSKQKSTSDEEKTLKKAEEVLGSIEETFEKQLNRLYKDDFLDLDTEVKVLEKTLKLDG